MKKIDIMQMANDGKSPSECLKAATAAGVEYPDAVWLVTDALKLTDDEVYEMESDYMEQC